MAGALCLLRIRLEEAGHLAVGIDVDTFSGREFRQAWHGHDVAGQGHDEAGAG